MGLNFLASCPDPTLCEGKGSSECGHDPWARERKLFEHSNQITVFVFIKTFHSGWHIYIIEL